MRSALGVTPPALKLQVTAKNKLACIYFSLALHTSDCYKVKMTVGTSTVSQELGAFKHTP